MADQVTLNIDGNDVAVPAGTLVLDAAAKLGIEIPVFCSHPKLDPVACCRMCLVEIEGPRGPALMTACSVPVGEGMVVRTDAEVVRETQEANLAFILLNHPLDCPICDKGGECPLQEQTMRFGAGISQLVEPKRHKKKHYLISDSIVLDQERCVICWRCIRYLDEWEDKRQLGLFERGGQTLIDIQDGQPVDAKTSGNIIDICPVGALTNRVSRFSYRPWEVERIPSIDPYDSTGANVRIDVRTHQIRRLLGRENMAVNDQWISDKTRFAYTWTHSEDRLKQPYVRKNGQLVPSSWKEALQFVVDKLNATKESHGAQAIGAIGGTKLSNESNYLLQKLMRTLVGTNNIDHRNGADVAALPTGLPAIVDIMKPQYGPDPKVDTVLFFGFDPAEEAPILDLHFKRSARRAGMKLIVAHPRKIEATRYGGPFMGYRPGDEVALLNALTAAAENSDVGEVKGVESEAIKQAAQLLADSENALIVYGPMVAQGEAGEDVRQALINLALATGNEAGLAYMGLDSNSQGCRDMGVLPNALPGHTGLDDEEMQGRLARAWNVEKLPTETGLSYKQMLDGAGSQIKALYVMGADPASERAAWADNLDKLDLLVVQELFMTETAKRADVVLPATSWAESDGTFTNCERRVQRAPKAFGDPQSKAAPDWMILDHLATRMGTNWPYADPRAITKEISEVVPQYAGIDWEALGDLGVQWDTNKVDFPLERRDVEPSQPAGDAANDDNDGLTLVTGTIFWDGGNLVYNEEKLHGIIGSAHVTLHPDDAERLDLAQDAPVTVSSRYGSLALALNTDPQVQIGTAWIPESLPGAPVGTLLNGEVVEQVTIEPREGAVIVERSDAQMDVAVADADAGSVMVVSA